MKKQKCLITKIVLVWAILAVTLLAPLECNAANNTGKEKLLVVCIDAGHYKGCNPLSGKNMYGYDEGIVTLKIALQLREELKKYGIDSYLTRETDNIKIGGYKNKTLDSGHISLRGEYAKKADLFVSLHTNANNSNANGYETCDQPVEINKTIVLINKVARNSSKFVKLAHEVGKAVTTANYEAGVSTTKKFTSVKKGKVKVKKWTDSYNDSLNKQGAVCYRFKSNGDYYGVLRGASNVKVPGMIIEHGFHTVEEVRRLAMEEDLTQKWAEADAYGIAKGFGLVND